MNSKKVTAAMFIFYLIALTWIILFKMEFSLDALGYSRNVNMVPFGNPVIVNGQVDYHEIIQNALAFIPFGLLICVLMEKRNFVIKILPILLTSLTFEVLQFVLAVGASDVTDLIMNTLGGAFGIGIALLISRVFPGNWVKIINIVSFVGAVVLSGFIGVLVVCNL